ncbi:unnamed protein product [Clavelina lepadiformis]|uniref:DUF1279 domain-containing protein n=1 Tax=Clavelina lepadiformis TaxID=159417 RepID=A0ABP0GY87_CLALP
MSLIAKKVVRINVEPRFALSFWRVINCSSNLLQSSNCGKINSDKKYISSCPNFCCGKAVKFCSISVLSRQFPKQSLVLPCPTFSIDYYEKLSYFQTPRRYYASSPKPSSEETEDDLQKILKDKSLGMATKLKLLFRQYGIMMIGVHLTTSAVWVAIFYLAVSRGIDILPFLENMGLFDFLERMGFSYMDKLKSSGASNFLMTYLLYELAKPIRYPVTLFGTIYAVRYLRKIGYFKPPPQSASMTQLVETQGKLLRSRFRKTTVKYRDRYKQHIKFPDRKRKPFSAKSGRTTSNSNRET